MKESLAFKTDLGNTVNHINLGFANSEFLSFGISMLKPEINNILKHLFNLLFKRTNYF